MNRAMSVAVALNAPAGGTPTTSKGIACPSEVGYPWATCGAR